MFVLLCQLCRQETKTNKLLVLTSVTRPVVSFVLGSGVAHRPSNRSPDARSVARAYITSYGPPSDAPDAQSNFFSDEQAHARPLPVSHTPPHFGEPFI